jgi:hypothetical protein
MTTISTEAPSVAAAGVVMVVPSPEDRAEVEDLLLRPSHDGFSLASAAATASAGITHRRPVA